MAAACAGLLDALPGELAGAKGRNTTEPSRARAWGEPPITLVCGSMPADLTEPPLILDGFAFSAVERDQQVVWTTRDRVVPVQLVIPTAYEDQAEIVLPLLPALKSLARG